MSTYKLNKSDQLYLVLSCIFITNALIAEIIGTKIFSLENTIGISPVDWQWGEYHLSFNLTAGVLLWPVVFITTDLINEYFGRSGVQKISVLTAIMIAYSFFMIYGTTQLSPATFWLDIHQVQIGAVSFTIDNAYAMVLTQSMGIMIGSISAFLIGQLIDATLFAWIKQRTQEKYLWLRSTGSTLISQGIDSYVVLWIAFYLLGGNAKWSMELVVAVGTMNYIYKLVVAIVLTPVIYGAHAVIDKYLTSE